MSCSIATVILFFNKPSMTLRCLDTIVSSSIEAGKNLATQRRHKIIVVNNGSTVLPIEFTDYLKRFETINITPNKGFSAGMNAGLKAAFSDPSTELVVTLSNDIELSEDFYTELLKLNNISPGALYCPHVYYLMDKTKPAYTHGELRGDTLSHHFDSNKDTIQFPEYYPAAALVWTRKAYELLQGFDEAYFSYWEDVDLSARAKKIGIILQSMPHLKIFHLGKGTTGGKKTYVEHFKRGRELTLSRIRTNTYN